MEGRKKGRSTGLTGYNVYSNEIRKSLLDSPNPPSFGEISRIIGKKWKAMEKKDRSFYQSKAKRMNKLALKNKSTVIDDDEYDVNIDDADEDDVINLVDEDDDVSAEELCSRRSSRVKKSPVVYQASTMKPKTPKAPPKSYTTKTPSSTPRRNLRHEVDLHMQCDDEELSYAQIAAMEAARREHEKANDLIKEFRAGHILVPSSQQNTFLLTTKVTPTTSTAPTSVPIVSPEPTSGNIGLPPPRPAQFLNKQQNEFSRSSGTNTQPDIILVGENLPASRGNLGTSLIHSTLQSPIIPMASTMPGHGQPLYKFVPTTVTQTLVQNQWAVRPLLKASLQQPGGMITAQSITLGSLPIAQTAGGIANMTSIKQPIQSVAPGQKRPVDSPSNPNKKKLKPGDDNWIPLDEYYYGTHEGDVSYTEEKGEYRFKCWYCSKMLYNNVRAMQHIQGHIDASKQQNIDLSDLTQCKHCYKQFDTPFDMQTHVEKVHLSNKVLMCRICERDFATQHDLMQHMKAMHKICEMPYVCQLCNFRSSMYSDVVDHFKKKHDSSHHLLCLYCLRSFEVKFVNQGWGQTQTYYGHLLKHQTKSSMKRCNTCRLTFFNSADVKNHRKNCHDSNPMHMQGQCSRLDTGVQQKKGSTLKSLNAPSISRIQDYGEIIFPAATKNMKCVECKIPMSSTDHYKKYIHCTMCRFATSCSVAYANHMMGFHSGQMSSLNLNIPWERPMKETMYCECNFSSKYGNKIADHLVHCLKWTSYSSKPLKTPAIMPPVIQVPSSDETKQEGSILGMLGLRKTPSDSSAVDKPKTEASLSKVESQKVKIEVTKKEEEESTKVDKKDQEDIAMELDENKETKESEISSKSVEGTTDATKDVLKSDTKSEDVAESSDSTKESEPADKKDDKVDNDKDGSSVKSEEKESAVDDDDNDDDECAIIETSESNKDDGKDKMEQDVIDLDSEEVGEKDESEEKSENLDSEVTKKVVDITEDGDDALENAGTSKEMREDEPEVMDITEEKSEDAEKISDAPKENQEETDMVDESVDDEKMSENLDNNMETTEESAEKNENVIKDDDDEIDDDNEKMTEYLDDDKTAGGEDKTGEEESKDAAADDDEGDNDESVNDVDKVESDVKESDTSKDVVDVDVDPQNETKSEKIESDKKAEEAGSNAGVSKDDDSKVVTDKVVDQPTEAKKEESVNVKESVKDDKSDAHHRRESSQDRRESSHDRDRHDNRSHDHRRDNRSNRPDHSSSGSRSHGGDYRDRSYDRDRGDRDHDRSWDRDRGRDRDHSRNQDYNRSGGGYHDNRDRGYRGHQGQGQHGGGGGGYHGNRDYQDRNRGGGGGGHHRQDRGDGYHQRNPNLQNRGGYNQNYRGSYRGGYY